VIAESEEELIKKLNRWKDGVQSKSVKVKVNKTKIMISGESQKGNTILEDGHVMFVAKVLVETQCSYILTTRNECIGSVVVQRVA